MTYPVKNISRISASYSFKIVPIRIRILIRKHKDSVRIFTGYCLIYWVLFISEESLEGLFRIMNRKNPLKFDSGSFSRFVHVSAEMIYWTQDVGSYRDSLSILFRILRRKIERIQLRFSQISVKIDSESWYENPVKSFSYIRGGFLARIKQDYWKSETDKSWQTLTGILRRTL